MIFLLVTATLFKCVFKRRATAYRTLGAQSRERQKHDGMNHASRACVGGTCMDTATWFLGFPAAHPFIAENSFLIASRKIPIAVKISPYVIRPLRGDWHAFCGRWKRAAWR
jgi:hypothetical protein